MSQPVIFAGTPIEFSTDPATIPLGGSSVPRALPFTSLAGNPVDPDVVQFAYRVSTGAWTTFTYTHGTGDPTSTIIRTGVGTYYCIIDTTGLAGAWNAKWMCHPDVAVAYDSTHTKVTRLYNEFLVSAAA